MSISTPPLSPSTPPAAPGGGGSWSVLLLNAVGPFVVFQALARAGVDALPALAAAAVLPLIGTVRGWVRPLVFSIGRRLTAGDDSEALVRYDDLWRLPAFRASQRTLTVAWGVWGFAQAAARTVLTATLPVGAVLAVWPLVDLLVTVLLVSWSISYSRRAARSE
jgi:hypothetical protein